MASKKSEYYQIITSLPLLQGKLSSDFEHMSRINFNKHIEGLCDEDFEMVRDLENFLIWERMTISNANDKEFQKQVIELRNKYKNKTFTAIVKFSTHRRLLLGLLRKRKAGLTEAPSDEELWDFPDIEYNIKHNWDKTDFGLHHIGANLAGFDKLTQEDEALDMEKSILQLSWTYFDKMAHGHYFDIDFILIYAMRRSIIERWSIATTPQDITEKFNTLALEAINGRN